MQCVPELLLKSAKDSISGLKRPVASVVVEKMTFCCPKLPTWLGGGTWRPIRKRAVTFKVLTLQRNIHIFTIAQIGQSFHFRAQIFFSSNGYREIGNLPIHWVIGHFGRDGTLLARSAPKINFHIINSFPVRGPRTGPPNACRLENACLLDR